MNPYRADMAELEIDPAGGYRQDHANWSCHVSEKGMNNIAALAVIYDEHVDELATYLYYKGRELCEYGYPFAAHEWMANDYAFDIDEPDTAVFMLWGYHNAGCCAAMWYEVHGKTGVFREY